MTPKEHAESLINKFITEGCLFANAQKCALIVIREIISNQMSLRLYYDEMEIVDNVKYWQEVKTEIEKL